MITINLLPLELRKRKSSATKIPYIPLAILAGVLFLLMTFFFYGDYLRVRSAHNRVQKEWARVSPSLAPLKILAARVDVEMLGEKDFLEKSVLNTESMTRVLSWVSEFLPPKGWLTSLQLERVGEGFWLSLKGVVLASPTQTGIEQLEEYFQKLKAKLPPQTTVTLTTSREAKGKTGGTAFEAELKWGATAKP